MNQRQIQFVDQYIKTGNATAAAIAAGYSEKSARSIGQENLTKPDIQKMIQERQKAVEKRTAISVDQVVNRVARLADNAKKESDRLKALDMLLRHLGGYMTHSEIMEKMAPEQFDRLFEEMKEQYKRMKG
jgi:phage terminase small subunit